VLARAYAARGIRNPDELDLSLGRLLPPDELLGADRAAARLAAALEAGERILFVGDFDADGATSCALGVRALRAFGAAQVDFLVPNRFEYGYGLSPEIVALAWERRPDLLRTRGLSDDERRLLSEYLRDRGTDPDVLSELPGRS